MKITPINDIVLIRPDTEKEKTDSGFIIPELSRQKSETGVVLAVGPGRMSRPQIGKASTFEPTRVKPGDRVMFNPFASLGSKRYLDDNVLVYEGNIVCILLNKKGEHYKKEKKI